LNLVGSLGLLLTYILLGIVVWAVMQSIAEMMTVSSIPGASTAFASELVNVDLVTAAYVVYWYVLLTVIRLKLIFNY
jgi:amino acid permease